MRALSQQTSFISTIAEPAEAWQRLVESPQQAAQLRAGDAKYFVDFITPDEETELLTEVDAAAWQTDMQRYMQQYGYRYDYTARTLGTEAKIGELPNWVTPITVRLLQRNIFATMPQQMLVNEYQPGQGIAPHTDRDCFGPVVASLSLGSDCMMRMLPRGNNMQDAFDIVLQRRSLLVLQGVSREVWRHSIVARSSDPQHGCKIPRQRRVSLTFRTVEDAPVQ